MGTLEHIYLKRKCTPPQAEGDINTSGTCSPVVPGSTSDVINRGSVVHYVSFLSKVPVFGLTAAQMGLSLVESSLAEPGSLGTLSHAHIRRSTGAERSGDHLRKDLLPLPLPALNTS